MNTLMGRKRMRMTLSTKLLLSHQMTMIKLIKIKRMRKRMKKSLKTIIGIITTIQGPLVRYIET